MLAEYIIENNIDPLSFVLWSFAVLILLVGIITITIFTWNK